MNTENQVAGHYGKAGLEETILQAIGRMGKDASVLTPIDLAPVDEFHTGGLTATKDLAAQMDLRPGFRLLDVGSGVGGPGRYFAAYHGCKVSGLDLTEEFVRVSNTLTKMMKLEQQAEFLQGSALQMPFPDETFDRACMIHVGMNIADKATVFHEVWRVLKPGGLFAIFDVMLSGDGALRYPVPWALSEETSFVAPVEIYINALEKAGFVVENERPLGAFAIEMTERNLEQMAKTGAPVVGLQLLMGERTPVMVKNLLGMMKEGLLEPVELVARRG
jgi:SAM-dependent methyltransferase